jgi:hypothetical protein
VNGTIDPVAMTHPGAQYQALMYILLDKSTVLPYGYDTEPPESTLGSSPEKIGVAVDILSEEITKLLSIVASQSRDIQHYSIAMPSFFTAENEELLVAAFRQSNLPAPRDSFPVDFAVLSSLETSNCPRPFEFDCRPIDYNTWTKVLVEYSNSTLSGYLSQLWGGGYLDRVAYFVDPELGNYTGGSKWEVVAKRVRALVEDNKAGFLSPISWSTADVVVFGQLASDPSFHRALRDALFPYTDKPILLPTGQASMSFGQIFIAASGAARSAKTSIDLPQHPKWCNKEEERCTRLREEIYQESLVAQPEDIGYWKDL